MQKITREVCLAKYRKFPLMPFDLNISEEVIFFPKVFSSRWFELPHPSKRMFTKNLTEEFVKLMTVRGFDRMVFLATKARPWITKLSAGRIDYPPLTKAVKYFESHQLGKRFTGGVEVPTSELHEFISHFYCLTRCDGSFNEVYFTDPTESFIGALHYSGELQICPMNKKNHLLFDIALKKTKFKLVEK